MQAVILTEAGSGFGLGHLSRCAALAEYLIDVGFEVVIYNRGDYEGRECVSFDWLNNDTSEILADNPLLVVDSYYADFEKCENLTQSSRVCVFFDDFNRMIYPKDSIMLNGALNAQRLYPDLQNEAYIGIEYSLLRDAFRTHQPKKIKKEVERILVTLGANDRVNNTQKILDILEREISYEIVDVVISDGYKPIHYGFDTNIHKNLSPDVLKNLMLECDIAISGGGITMVELQSTHTPTIALQIAPNQAYQLRAWRNIGLRVAENVYQIKPLLKTLRKFKDRKKLSSRLAKIEIGKGVPHFIQDIVRKYHAVPLKLRK